MWWAVRVLALVLQAQLAQAMDFEAQHPLENPHNLIIWASGEIKLGDDRKLHDFVAARPAGEKLIGIVINSPGGNLFESHRLAMTIRNTGMTTGVKGTCASACFLLFVAGNSKMVFPGSRIGVHSASIGSIETMGSEAATTEMARTARSLGTPDAIVGKMVVTIPERMAWLSNEDLRTIPGMRIVTRDEFESSRNEPSKPYQPGSELRPGSGQAAAAAPVAPAKPSARTASADGHFNIDGALKAGHTPTEILDFLVANPGITNYSIAEARSGGYSDIAILQYLETHNTWGTGFSPAGPGSLTPSETQIPDVTQNSNYIAGRNARLAWENWFGGLSGDGRGGADWWAGHRTTAARDHSSCEDQFLMTQASAAWLQGCQQARQLLLQPDQQRRTDVSWKAGWNSF